ncbi:MAG: hypothetical protein OSJ73_14010 [Lachnospiraceae bacterium]|nr:hypothetical protein [Lachnospiraceae bacterium]
MDYGNLRWKRCFFRQYDSGADFRLLFFNIFLRDARPYAASGLLPSFTMAARAVCSAWCFIRQAADWTEWKKQTGEEVFLCRFL